MLNNTLVILDLNKNYDLFEKKVKFVSLNKGLINLENCEQIYLKKFQKDKNNVYKKLLSVLLKVIPKNKKIPLIELEINNLRNDRYDFIDRIINLTIVKKIILLGGFTKIKIISDNKSTLEIFDKLNIKIEKIDFSKKKKLNFFRLKLLKFYLKTLFVVIFLKFKKEDQITKKKSEFFFSIHPNKFVYNKKNLDKELFFNFLLTDETHLNHNIFKIFKIIKNNQFKNTINVESFISIKYLLRLILKNIFVKINYDFHSNELKFDGLDFNNEIKFFYISSLLNRFKLNIYENAIKALLKKFDIQTVHMYLFEYSFGFYLINKIKNFSKKIMVIGYQHGVFSKNLMWLDFLGSIRNNKNYLPNKILASNIYSARDYKEKLKKIPVKIPKEYAKKTKAFVDEIKIKKKSNNIIVLPGTHDISDLYYFFKNSENLKEKKFFFKLHPKNKFLFENSRNIYAIKSHKIKDFSEIIISQTSSLIYDFLKMKKFFFVVDFDYKSDLLNKRILNKTISLNRKKTHEKVITFKI